MVHPDKVGVEAKKKEDENFKFRSFLKGHADEEELDEQFLRLHKELFADYDCSKCRNCCKMYKGSIPEEDLEKDAEYLGITVEQFIDFFLEKEELGIGYHTKHKPCDFLQEDGNCKLRDCKPDSCKKYPYTDQPERLCSLLGMLDTISICPVAFEIFERLKKEYGFKRRQGHMRKEASIEQWKALYEAGTRIKELKPQEKFWDMDLIGIRYGAEEETIFFSILGRGGDCYGITVCEGYDGLNSFLMLTMQQSMNLAPEYAMFNQRNLTCYQGNRDELSDKQRKIIKELGYTYRGKNQWLYFLSFEPGYYPYNMDEEEVLRMSVYLQDLELALRYYDETDMQVDFESGNMFLLSFEKDKKRWNFGKEPLPFTAFQFGNLLITDEELLSELGRTQKCDAILEADVSVLGASVMDKKYARPANPALSLLGDANTGTVIKFEMLEPEEDAIVMLAEILIGFIFRFGAPKEIRVSNIIVEAGLEQICNVCGIKLRRVKRLKGLEDFKYSMQRFRQQFVE